MNRKSNELRAARTSAVSRETAKWIGIGGFFRFLWLHIVIGTLGGILGLLARAP